MPYPIITLTTDFGLRDPYVAEMKAVILGINPKTRIVDVTHQVKKFDVRMGAYLLASASPYFQRGTVHVAVVDPGVGTDRQPIIVQTGRGCFVGPDNGILAMALRRVGGKMRVYRITNRESVLQEVSNTFHGRDIFAPVAAHLASGRRPGEMGQETRQMLMPEFARVVKRKHGLEGQVVYVDDFGNIITNLGLRELETMETGDLVNVKVGNTRLTLRLCKAYGDVKKRQPLAIIGSHNFFEVSVNQGSAASVLNVKTGDDVVLYNS
jgi:S-adenosylmethionine hydrolase